MQNLDIAAIASLADASLQLVQSAPGSSEQEFEANVGNWVSTTTDVIQKLGATNKMKALMEQFSLDPPTTALVSYALLPSLDSKYSSYFGELQDHPSANVPTLDLLGTLVSADYESKNQLNAQLEDESPIFFWRILNREQGSSFADSKVHPSRDLVLHFSEDGTLDKDFSGLVVQISSPELNLPFDKVDDLPTGRIITINGGFPARQSSFAYKLAEAYRQPLYELNNHILRNSENPQSDLKEGLLFTSLNNGILFWPDGSQALNAQPELVPIINTWLQLKGTRLIIGETHFQALPAPILDNPVDSIDLVQQDRQMDELIWRSVGEQQLGVSNIDYSALNNRYYTDYSRILETVLRTKQLASDGEVLSTQLVEDSYIKTSPVSLAGLAHLLVSDVSFADMILTPAVQTDMDSIEKAYLNRVLLDPSQPSGVISIFEGAVGTGKTMAAECLGNKIGLPLYKIDYSRMSEDSGLTEATLNNLFKEAEKNSACLLFDEADALFAKKSPDATNPHNLIIAYLIQQIEQYNGLIILTTNQKPKIDKAIFRRAMIAVTFPPFKPQQRYDLFVKVLADMGVQVESKVNLKQLMLELNANGQQVTNIINNAVLSASDSNVPLDEIVIAAKDLARAIKIERNK